MTPRSRILRLVEKALAVEIMLLIAGTPLLFGGGVGWMKPAIGIAVLTLALTTLLRAALIGRWGVLKSPLTTLGLLAIGLAALQSVPLPGRLASGLSPKARAVHALGVLPDLAASDDPSVAMPEVVADRTPATIDRPATLRWVVGALACLAVFIASSHYADRLSHTSLIWGSVVAAMFVGTTFGIAQLVGGVSGLYGVVEPGSGKALAPSLADLASAPGSNAMRPVGDASGWGIARPDRPFLLGTMLGGPGAYLALSAIGLPLALGLMLQLLAPRGSREPITLRLRASGRMGLAVVLVGMTLASAGLVGFFAGPWLAAPFALALALIGLLAAWPSGLRWLGIGLTVMVLMALGGGVGMAETLGRPRGIEAALDASSWPKAVEGWKGAGKAARQFPLIGSGLGTFPTLAAYLKTTDETPTTAGSSLLQWGVEAGLAGLALLGLGGLWCVARIPGALRRVGSADKVLALALIGTGLCFGAVSALHWTVEVMAVALAACAVAGTANRWLAGGTDLFVEGV